MSGIKIFKTKLAGVLLLELSPHCDHRGSFSRLFCHEMLPLNFVQMSLSMNKMRGTLRGLHFQKEPYAEDKLVHCLKGRVFDVIVDLRKDSLTFGEHITAELSFGKELLVPKGCAHGFLTLEDESELLYCCTTPYHAESASGILWNDPVLNIEWPFEPLIISEADKTRPTLEEMHALSLL